MSFNNPGYSPLSVLGENDGSSRVGHSDGNSVAQNIETLKSNVAGIADKQTALINNYPVLFDMMGEALKFTGWQANDPGGVVEVQTTTTGGKGSKVLQVNGGALSFAGLLICYLAENGEWYTARIESNVGNTLTLADELEHNVASGATVSNVFSNSNHPNVNGYASIVDYALRTKTQTVVKSFPVVDYTKFNIGDTVELNSNDEYDNPGSSDYPSVSVTTAAVNSGIYSGSLAYFSGGCDLELVINTYGNNVRIRLNVDDDVLAYTDRDITVNTTKPTLVKIPLERKNESRVYFDMRTPDGAGTFDFILKNITRTESRINNLDGGIHVLHGDSWFAQVGMLERFQTRLPNATFINNGVGGRTSANLASNFESEVEPLNPNFVWCMCGTNDYVLGVSVSGFYQWMKKLVAYIRQSGAIPMMFTTSVGNLIDGGALSRSRAFYYGGDYRETDVTEKNYETVVVSWVKAECGAMSETFVGSVGRTFYDVKVLECYASAVNNLTLGFSSGMSHPTHDVIEKAGNTIINVVDVPKTVSGSRYMNVGVKNTTGSTQYSSGFARIKYLPLKK